MWPFQNRSAAELEQLRARIALLEAQVQVLEQSRAGWVAEVCNLVDKLTSIENRQRMRQNRQQNGGAHQGSLSDYRRGKWGS